MRIIGCDLHARQQTVAMLDTTTGEVVKMTLTHEGNNVREFYSSLALPVRVGIEATGSMQWFVSLMEELGIYTGQWWELRRRQCCTSDDDLLCREIRPSFSSVAPECPLVPPGTLDTEDVQLTSCDELVN